MEFLAGSLVELITQTSTNLPPDVRAAMALDRGLRRRRGTQSAQALDIIFSNIDMAIDDEGPICQDTGMPDFRGAHSGGREPDRHQAGHPRGGRGGHPAGQAAAQFGGFASPAKTAATIWARNPGDPLRAVGRGRDRSEADPEGRRLREQEHPVFAALRAGPSGPRRPQPGRRAEVHAARGLAGAGPGLRAGRARRLHRQRPRAWLRPGQGTAFPHAGRCEPRSRCWRSSKPKSWRRPTSSAWAPWASAARSR